MPRPAHPAGRDGSILPPPDLEDGQAGAPANERTQPKPVVIEIEPGYEKRVASTTACSPNASSSSGQVGTELAVSAYFGPALTFSGRGCLVQANADLRGDCLCNCEPRQFHAGKTPQLVCRAAYVLCMRNLQSKRCRFVARAAWVPVIYSTFPLTFSARGGHQNASGPGTSRGADVRRPLPGASNSEQGRCINGLSLHS